MKTQLKNSLARLKIFQKVLVAIFFLFFSLMVLVTLIAFSRKSGVTGLDPAKIQQMRFQGSQKNQFQQEAT